MKLTSLRIRHYRTIGATEQSLPLESSLTIVGANNTGKTNTLKAIALFFIGYENNGEYDLRSDKPFGAGNVKSSLLATFEGDDSNETSPDRLIYQQLDKLYNLYDRKRTGATFSLSLVFSPSGNPVYQFFPNLKKPSDPSTQTQISRIQKLLVNDLISRFAIHYVPSAKSIGEIYEEVLAPFLRQTARRVIDPYVNEIRQELDSVANSVTEELKQAGLDEVKASFSIPEDRDLLSGFDFNLSDPHDTPIFRKGQGIQSTSILASFLWVTSEERKLGKSTIWLLEEPESYLHPQLTETSRNILEKLGKESLVVISTHALSFVPQDPLRTVGTTLIDQNTHISRYETYAEATESIRRALGVRFSDYYNLTEYNLLLEGRTDRKSLQWFLAITAGHESCAWPKVRAASLLDFGGTGGLAGFLRATFPIIHRERAVVAIFDGDSAGEKERRSLQAYFGGKQIPFDPGHHFLILRDRFALEGLWPDEFISSAASENPTWFKDFSTDIEGKVLPFQVRDQNKQDLLRLLYRKSEEQTDFAWADRWVNLLDTAELALTWQANRLSRSMSD